MLGPRAVGSSAIIASRTKPLCLAFFSLAISCAVVSLGSAAHAQEDSAEDHGSRAVKKAKSSKSKHKKKKKKKHKKANSFDLGYELGAFGGTYLEERRFGPVLNAAVVGSAKLAKHRLSLELDYGYDHFSTKTFNFPEEESAPSDARLTQPMHELAATAKHGVAWGSWFSTALRARADWWLPEQPMDERRAVRVQPELRFGKKTGVYASLATDVFYKLFPNYEVQDRKLDQRGLDSTFELGYTFAPYTRVALGTELDYTQYLDARYDVLTETGTIERSPRSKRYLERSPYVYVSVRPIAEFRASMKYAFELNDSFDYDRRMTGRTNGDLIAKFIRDYYDYERHRITLNTQTAPLNRLEFGTLSEVWFRDFNTYEARDVDNNWTGDKRHDFSLELGLEASYQLLQFEGWGTDHGLFASAFGSYLRRRSNMRREVSIATNFDVTRLFVGLELRDL